MTQAITEYCPNCGSDDLETRAWVKVNGKTYVGPLTEDDDNDTIVCVSCLKPVIGDTITNPDVARQIKIANQLKEVVQEPDDLGTHTHECKACETKYTNDQGSFRFSHGDTCPVCRGTIIEAYGGTKRFYTNDKEIHLHLYDAIASGNEKVKVVWVDGGWDKILDGTKFEVFAQFDTLREIFEYVPEPFSPLREINIHSAEVLTITRVSLLAEQVAKSVHSIFTKKEAMARASYMRDITGNWWTPYFYEGDEFKDQWYITDHTSHLPTNVTTLHRYSDIQNNYTYFTQEAWDKDHRGEN